MLGALDGAAFMLDPGPYSLQIYLFNDHVQMHRGIELLEESVLRNILGETDTILLIMDNTLDAAAPTYP